MEYSHIVHPFPPLYDEESKILILGSFPSVKSREQRFFYGHPQNRFWKVMAAILNDPVPVTIEEKQAMLHRNHVALWDVIGSCDIKGSSDSSIRNALPTDLNHIIEESRISRVFCNGKTSGQMYSRYQEKRTGISAEVLPSTSPANAAWTLDKLTKEWKRVIGEI